MATFIGACDECGKTTTLNQKVLGWAAYCQTCEYEIFRPIIVNN